MRLALPILALLTVPLVADRADEPLPLPPAEVLEQIDFPKPTPPLMWVDERGNVLLPVVADAVVTYDGGSDPMIAASVEAAAQHGSRCIQSLRAAMVQYDGPLSVVCLPREYDLHGKMIGEPREGPPP